MNSNMLFGSNQPPPFFHDSSDDENMMSASSLNYYQDDVLLDIQNSWIENIHPLLRSSVSDQQQAAYQYHQQQQRLQNFINAPPERTLFTTPSYPQYHQGVRSVPGPQRNISPAPSHDFTSSNSTSARSPAAEQDLSYYSPQGIPGRDDFHLPSSQGLGQGQGFDFDPWSSSLSGPGNGNGLATNFHHVNMSQVQSFPDPMYDSTTADEGFIDMHNNHKTHDGAYHMETRQSHITSSADTYQGHYPVDEALGASIKDAASPIDSTQDENDNDLPEEVFEEQQEEDEDEEYVPTTTRSGRTSRKRTLSSYSPQQQSPSKRARRNSNPKPLSKSKSSPKHAANTAQSLTCPSCPKLAPFKDSATLVRHIATAHTRPYTCIFAFAGCISTFASKNEWKRHVQSQHLVLTAWVCTLGACGKINNAGTNAAPGRGSEFNRKDLFTQHCRRMHAPAHLSSSKKAVKDQAWEERLKGLQEDCLVTKREAPRKLNCTIKGCPSVFEGKACWDEMMEHVGKHLEKLVVVGAGVGVGGKGVEIRQGEDRLLVEWAERQGIVSRKRDGGWGFAGTSLRDDAWSGVGVVALGNGVRGGSADAEGEIDDGF